MGYQDGFGLRPGRTQDKLNSDRKDTLSTARNAASGYRAAGSISPYRAPDMSQAGLPGESPLSQFSVPQMQIPEAPGLLQTAGTAVGTKLAGDAVERGASKLFDTYFPASSSFIPGASIKAANQAADPIYALGDSEGWWAGSAGEAQAEQELIGGAPEAGGFGEMMGTYGPYIPAAAKLVQGDVGGAAKSGIGTYAGQAIGNLIVPGIGGAVGGFIGGVVGGDCFITEATMAGLGVQDDEAEPLKVLRFFRDKVLAGTPQGQAMIEEYENIAPLVVEAVEARPDAMEIFKQLYEQFIAPAVEAVKAGNYPEALQIYAAMIAAVTPFAQEAMQMQDAVMQEEPQAEMQQMGNHAAQVAQNPQVAQQATGALNQFNADDQRPTSVRFGKG